MVGRLSEDDDESVLTLNPVEADGSARAPCKTAVDVVDASRRRLVALVAESVGMETTTTAVLLSPPM